MAAAVSDRVVEAVALAGTPEQVVEQLERYRDLVDFLHVMAPLDVPAEVIREQTLRIVDALAEARLDARPAA
jgi:alkanesulfonate monooxygenase SsuD/methylene tetrahydromethanopterin reductase-like flavin-dependent oxidoreductase (luciferase family)